MITISDALKVLNNLKQYERIIVFKQFCGVCGKYYTREEVARLTSSRICSHKQITFEEAVKKGQDV